MSRNRILLVEDNEDNFELVRFLLERAGYQVFQAGNEREGLKVAQKEQPDLILMDLSLPELDGWTAGRELKANPKTAHIPLYAIPAHTLPGDRKRALNTGFDGYFSKHINEVDFAHAVAKTIRGKPKRSKQH